MLLRQSDVVQLVDGDLGMVTQVGNSTVISLCFDSMGNRINGCLQLSNYDTDLEHRLDYQYSVNTVYRPNVPTAISQWIEYRDFSGYDVVWSKVPKDYRYYGDGTIEIDGVLYKEAGPVITGVHIICDQEYELRAEGVDPEYTGVLEWVFDLGEGIFRDMRHCGRYLSIDFEYEKVMIVVPEYGTATQWFDWNYEEES